MWSVLCTIYKTECNDGKISWVCLMMIFRLSAQWFFFCSVAAVAAVCNIGAAKKRKHLRNWIPSPITIMFTFNRRLVSAEISRVIGIQVKVRSDGIWRVFSF